MKPKNKKEVNKILKNAGFIMVSHKKHEKWVKGEQILVFPGSHKEFHVIGHWQILKRAGLV
jgi:hypothetical protein